MIVTQNKNLIQKILIRHQNRTSVFAKSLCLQQHELLVVPVFTGNRVGELKFILVLVLLGVAGVEAVHHVLGHGQEGLVYIV